jgi:demethylmenaquinone methyltransferase/2-methoxy-6-polyprenyl-1,4-benzoquinol methylase
MTLRMDVGWRRKTVAALELAPGSVVLDVACGTGDLCRDLAAAQLRPVGADFSAGMLSVARTDAPLVRADALSLPVPDDAIDGVTCGFALRNFSSLEGFFAETRRVLRPGGRFAFLDVAEPEQALLRAGHHFYFRKVVPFVGGLLSDRAAYAYLPASTVYLPPPARLVAMLRAHGFTAVRRATFGLGAAQLLSGAKA